MKYKYYDEKGEHLHTLDDRPLIGTSTALKVLAKPLTWWASGLACAELGWLNSKTNPDNIRLEKADDKLKEISVMGAKEYLALLDKA